MILITLKPNHITHSILKREVTNLGYENFKGRNCHYYIKKSDISWTNFEGFSMSVIGSPAGTSKDCSERVENVNIQGSDTDTSYVKLYN